MARARCDLVGDGVSASRLGTRVWCFGAQSYRPFGTAAELAVVPTDLAIGLSDRVSFEQGACLGIPGITAHRAVHVAGPVAGRTVLVQAAPDQYDFPSEAKAAAAVGLNEALEAGWTGFEITERFPLEDIALAHRFVERPPRPGRVVVTPQVSFPVGPDRSFEGLGALPGSSVERFQVLQHRGDQL